MPENTENNLLETAALCTLRIDNKEIKNNVSLIQLVQTIDGHHTLLARVQQEKGRGAGDFDNPDNYTAFLGKSVSLNIKPTGGMVDASRELEFIGTVTQINLDNSIDGLNTVLITGKSPTIALDGAKKNVFYFDQSASDIMGSVVRKYSITVGNVESTKGTPKFVVQYRETDYDFIMRLAGHNGKFAFYDGKEFRITKASGSSVEELLWRETLGSFSFGLGTQPPEYASQVYNYEQHKTFSQDSKSLSSQTSLSPMLKTSPDASKNIYKDSCYSTAPKSVPDAQSLDEILQNEKNCSLSANDSMRGIVHRAQGANRTLRESQRNGQTGRHFPGQINPSYFQ